MPRGVSCIPQFLKDELVKVLDDSSARINDIALEQVDEDESKVKQPPVVKSVINLTSYIQSLPVCD